MESEKQARSGGGAPGRPPPPHYPSAPPPYYDPQSMYPTAPAPGGPYYPPPPPSYPEAYQMGFPPPTHPGAPPVYPGGHSMYPDVSQLPQPEAVPLGFVTVSQGSPGALAPGTLSTGPLSPVRPAPPPPDQNPVAQNFVDPSLLRPGQHPSSAPLKDGQPPPGCVVSWRGGEGLQVFFMQSEGHIVSPKKPLVMSVYKRIGGTHEGDENLLGMIEVHGCCRLKFTTKISFALHSSGKSYVFLDNSTCPERIVVLLLPSNVSKTMQADLLSLINELTDLREEQESMVGKITTGVGTVYTDLTKKLNTVVKETVPGAHKSTKWLRKGTGSLVRMSGNVVSKGMHVIADHIPANEQPKEESPVHTQLLTALRHFKNCKEEDSITYV